MGALGDKFLINFLQAFDTDFPALVQTADFVILAETAVEVATAEKYGTAASGTTDTGFFPLMQPGSGYDGQPAAAAGTQGSGRTF